MTAAPDRLQVLLDRACRGVATPAEAEQLRAGVAELQQQTEQARRTAGGLQSKVQQQRAQLGACHRDQHVAAERILDLVDELKRYERYRSAWLSARARAHLIPEAGQEIHDGTRWRPALQAYSVLRARLAKAEQQLAMQADDAIGPLK